MNEIEEKTHVISPEWEKRYGPGKSLVPRALDIERLINQTKKGQLLTNDIIRETLAKEKNVLVTEPMTHHAFKQSLLKPARVDTLT